MRDTHPTQKREGESPLCRRGVGGTQHLVAETCRGATPPPPRNTRGVRAVVHFRGLLDRSSWRTRNEEQTTLTNKW